MGSAPDRDEWCVAVARVRRAHGLGGEVTVTVLTDRPERLGDLREVAVVPPMGAAWRASLEGWRFGTGVAYVKLRGVNDREAAEKLRGAELRIRRDMRYELEEGEYWVEDLVGMAVVTEDGRSLGTIHEVLPLPANDVYATEHCLIPAIREVVLSVDTGARKMVVRAVAGLAPELGI